MILSVHHLWFHSPFSKKLWTLPSRALELQKDKILCRVEGGIYNKYNSDIACSLPGVHKLYNKLIAYQIFEIGFDRRRQCLKIDFEDFNETMAILKKSNWVWRTVTFTAAEACGGDGQFLNFSQDSRQSTSQSKTIINNKLLSKLCLTRWWPNKFYSSDRLFSPEI